MVKTRTTGEIRIVMGNKDSDDEQSTKWWRKIKTKDEKNGKVWGKKRGKLEKMVKKLKRKNYNKEKTK